MTKAYLATYVLACALGYVARIFVEWSQRRSRERVVRALGGRLPDWELCAREIEERAHRAVMDMTHRSEAEGAARMLQKEADITRARGRRRDREWR